MGHSIQNRFHIQMSKNNYLLNEGIIQVGKKVYKITDGPDGHLCLYSATLDSEFTPVKIHGNAPTNRYKYACIQCGNSHFLLLGGDSETIDEFEIWKFSTKSLQWYLLENMSYSPLKCRYGHSVAFSPQKGRSVLYIFGGIRGIEVCQSLVIVTLSKTSYTYSTIDHISKGWPCPRYFSSMITMQGTIWVFGGTDMNGNKLSDLWEMDHTLFDSNPRWISHSTLPPARDLHISWACGTDLYIAGGFGSKCASLNDIWKFSKGVWQQTMIFESDFPIFSCGIGLYEVSSSLKLARQRSPFAGLDGLFNKLRLKQRVYTEQSLQDERNLSELRAQSAALRSQCDALEQFSKDKKRTPAIDGIVSMFSDERRAEIQKRSQEVRLQLAKNMKDIIESLPSAIRVESCLSKPKVRELAMQLSLKEKQDAKRMAAVRAERQMEIDIYKSQIERLEGDANSRLDVASLPNIDPSDFSTFQDFSSTLKPKGRGYALTLFYEMQLREYQRLLCESQLLQSKIAKIDERQPRHVSALSHLSRKLTKKFGKVAALQAELESWRKNLGDAERDCEQVQAYLGALGEYKESPQGLMEKVEAAKKANAQLQEQLQQELADVTAGKRDAIEQMFKATQQLSEQIKNQTAEEAHSAVIEALPSLNYYLSYIVPATN